MNEFDRIVRENFDLSDNYTRRYIVGLKEDAQQDQLLHALSIALYESIVNKVDDIDFGTIPASRGDITKVQGFEGTVNCLQTMRALVMQYKQNPSVVDVVLTALDNVRDRKALFIKGFSLDAEFPMLMYNLIVLAIERCTSLMIATCIQFINDPNTDTPKKALDKVAYKKSMEDVMFKQLISFNNLCKTKEFDKALESSMKAGKFNENVEIDYDTKVVMPVADEVPSNVVPDSDDDLFGSEPAAATTPDDECGGACAPAPAFVSAPMGEDQQENPEATGPANSEPTGPEDECGCDGSCNGPMDGATLVSNEDDDNTAEVPMPWDTNPDDYVDNDVEEVPATAPEDEAEDPMIDAQASTEPYQSTRFQDIDLSVEPRTINSDSDENIEIDIESIPNNDDVEPENIPAVNPGDAVSSTDAPINEDEDEDVEDSLEEGTKAELIKAGLDRLRALSGADPDDSIVKTTGKALKNAPTGVKIAVAVAGVLGTGVFLFKAKNVLIDFIRKCVYSAYYTSAKFSDYLQIQADLLESNANELEVSTNSDLADEKKERVIKKQRATAEKFRKWSNFFAIDKKKTENDVNKATKEDEQNRKRIAKDDDGDDALF